MPNFLAVDELSYRYLVSAERLLAYALRGNLSMTREDGLLRFDAAQVARLFPKRGEAGGASEPSARLGTLGRIRLGVPPKGD